MILSISWIKCKSKALAPAIISDTMGWMASGLGTHSTAHPSALQSSIPIYFLFLLKTSRRSLFRFPEPSKDTLCAPAASQSVPAHPHQAQASHRAEYSLFCMSLSNSHYWQGLNIFVQKHQVLAWVAQQPSGLQGTVLEAALLPVTNGKD